MAGSNGSRRLGTRSDANPVNGQRMKMNKSLQLLVLLAAYVASNSTHLLAQDPTRAVGQDLVAAEVQSGIDALRIEAEALRGRQLLLELRAESVVPAVVKLLNDGSFTEHLGRLFAYEVLLQHQAWESTLGMECLIKGLGEPAGRGYAIEALGQLPEGHPSRERVCEALKELMVPILAEKDARRRDLSASLLFRSLGNLRTIDEKTRSASLEALADGEYSVATRMQAARLLLVTSAGDGQIVELLRKSSSSSSVAWQEGMMFAVGRYRYENSDRISQVLADEVRFFVSSLATSGSERVQMGLLDVLPLYFSETVVTGDRSIPAESIEIITRMAGSSSFEAVRIKAANTLLTQPWDAESRASSQKPPESSR